MKTLTLCLFTLCLLAGHGVHARELVIAVSPHMQPGEAKQQMASVLQFLTTLEPGDEALILDGFSLSSLGRFTIPANPAYNSPKARIGANRSVVGAMMRFAKEAAEASPTDSEALRLPQLLRHVAVNIASGEVVDVIVLGSAFYDDPKEPVFSMADGLIPGDGHLAHSRSKTPFGTADNSELLNNLRIHFAYTGDIHSDQHLFMVQRFWTLFIEQQSGQLITFTKDRTSVFRRVKNDAAAPAHTYKPATSDKLEMIRLRTEEVQQSIYERPVTNAPLPANEVRRAENIEVAISWDCQICDIDLYAQAHPGAQILYFGHTESPEGIYYKDYRQSPEATNGRETIAFRVGVDLSALRIALNFYAGQAHQGVNGEIRIAVGTRTYASAFHIAATEGNTASNMSEVVRSGRSSHSQSIVIDPLRVLGVAR